MDVVQVDAAQAGPGVRKQPSDEKRPREAHRRRVEVFGPAGVIGRRCDQQEDEQIYGERAEVERTQALNQESSRSPVGAAERTRAAHSATPPTITVSTEAMNVSHALRRAFARSYPTSMSSSKCRIPD